MIGCSSHDELILQIQYLTVENRILRSKLPQRVRLDDRDRRKLIRFGKPLGPALKHLISIVQYTTFQKWTRKGKPRKGCGRKMKTGRPATPAQIRKIVIEMGRTPGWGCTRILGELRKVGIRSISRSTIRTILRQHGIDPAPDRDDSQWSIFLKRHAATLWSCDFLTKDVLTLRGVKRYSVLVFLHIESRKVLVTKATARPNRDWVDRAAECFANRAQQLGMPRPTILIRDNDKKFGREFDETLEREGVKAHPLPLPLRAPMMNAHIERWIGSIKRECLNHFMPVGVKHLDYLISEYVDHYHCERPHQGIGNVPIIDPKMTPGDGEIECTNRLGGLLRHYHRAA